MMLSGIRIRDLLFLEQLRKRSSQSVNDKLNVLIYFKNVQELKK